jgi:hypothetical protein
MWRSQGNFYWLRNGFPGGEAGFAPKKEARQ